MHKYFTHLLKVVIILFVISGVAFTGGKKMAKSEKDGIETKNIQPPKAKRVEKELTAHGDTRIDNYYWLRERENPEVINYLKAENKYTEKMLEHTKKFQDKIYKEIIGRFKKSDKSVPYKKNGYYYYTRYEGKSEYPMYCRKKESLENEEQIMLNVNKMAEGSDFYHVTGVTMSTNNNIIAFGVDNVGRRKYTIKFKNLETGKFYEDAIPNTTGSSAWANDNKTIFYSKKDKTLRSYKIFKHILGTDLSKDEEVYHEKDPTFSVYAFKTKSEKYIMIACMSTLSDEFRYLDADKPEGEFKIIQPRERNLEYSVDHFKDHFYIRTNLKAKNFRLMKTPVDKTIKENWKEVIPHRKNVFFQGFEIFNKYLVLSERKNGLTELRIINWDDGSEHYLDFGEQTYTAGIGINPEFDTEVLRYRYSSLTTPRSTYDYNMKTKQKKLLKQEEILGDFSPENYFAERHYAEARDGTKIPISLVYRKGLEKNGTNPLLLYGYGSYGASMSPYFSSVRLSLLDRGFIYAIAHIRGGQEMGRDWYEQGKLLNKINTFTDFIDCAKYLIEKNFTSKSKLFAMGGSAGGLLMGAVANMRPDLFKGIIARVPWVDVVTTMLDESIPLTTSEYDEWGDPRKKEYYDYMLKYSPYDNVKAQEYPHMFVTTGLHDSQVQYFEPAKWVAKLRYKKTGDNVILLHVNMHAGHGGASGRFRSYKRTAMIYAFMFDLLDIKK